MPGLSHAALQLREALATRLLAARLELLQRGERLHLDAARERAAERARRRAVLVRRCLHAPRVVPSGKASDPMPAYERGGGQK